jgi:hypothetical protein
MQKLFEQQQEILREHVKRSNSNEKHIFIVEKTLEKHLQFVRGAMWFAGFLASSLIAILGLVVKFLN